MLMTDSDQPLRAPHNQIQPTLQHLLDVWNLICGQSVRMTPAVERSLYEFSKIYSKADLEDTLNFIVYRNRHNDRPWHLRFEKFFDSEFLHFESLRAEGETAAKAKAAKKRAWVASDGEKTLGEFRCTEPVPPATPAKRLSTDFVIEALKQAKQ